MICYSFVKNLWNGRIKGQKTLYRITLASTVITGYCQTFPLHNSQLGLAIPSFVPRLRTVCIRDLGARLGHLATIVSSTAGVECYCVCERVSCNS